MIQRDPYRRLPTPDNQRDQSLLFLIKIHQTDLILLTLIRRWFGIHDSAPSTTSNLTDFYTLLYIKLYLFLYYTVNIILYSDNTILYLILYTVLLYYTIYYVILYYISLILYFISHTTLYYTIVYYIYISYYSTMFTYKYRETLLIITLSCINYSVVHCLHILHLAATYRTTMSLLLCNFDLNCFCIVSWISPSVDQ